MEDSRKPVKNKLDSFVVGNKTLICFEIKGQEVEWPCIILDRGEDWVEVIPYTALVKQLEGEEGISFEANRKLEEIQSVDREGNVINTGRYMLV